MAEMKLIENGVTRRRTTRKRRTNGATARKRRTTARRKTANPVRRRRRSAPKVTRRRRTYRRKNNGLFGDSKETVKAVLSLGGGMVGTKIAGGILIPFISKVLTPLGVGSFSQVASEALVSLIAVRPIASKIGGRDAGKFAMLGGLTISALDAIDMMLPSTLPLNPFAMVNSAPIMLNPAPASVSGTGYTRVKREIPLH